jgi:predicted dehydrogenase
MFAILGAGFGLYGYLPALVGGCEQRVVLPERYRARFSERSELARFAVEVQWEEDEVAALACADGVALALRPSDQVEWVHRCLARPNIKRLLLEKPLAQSPEASETLLDALKDSGKVYRIGYAFRYTTWGKRLLSSLKLTGETGALSIDWCFLAHHFRHDLSNWKRFNATGGGAIRFYGIHLIALLAEMGYHNVIRSQALGASPDELETWIAAFTGSGRQECNIVVDTRSAVEAFRVQQISRSRAGLTTDLANLSNPFDVQDETVQSDPIDQRVPTLTRHCRSVWEEDANDYAWYDATIALWRAVEQQTQFELRRS